MKFIQNVMKWGSTIISLAILAFQASVVHFHHVITAQDCYLDNPSLCKSRAVVLGCGFFGIFSKKHSPGVDFHLIFIHSLRLFNFLTFLACSLDPRATSLFGGSPFMYTCSYFFWSLFHAFWSTCHSSGAVFAEISLVYRWHHRFRENFRIKCPLSRISSCSHFETLI